MRWLTLNRARRNPNFSIVFVQASTVQLRPFLTSTLQFPLDNASGIETSNKCILLAWVIQVLTQYF